MAKIADVSYNYSEIESLISDIGTRKESYDDMIKSLDSLVDSLDGQWQGYAQKEFSENYKKLRAKLMNISTMLEQYSTEIRRAMEEAMQRDSNTANDFRKSTTPTF